MNYMSLFIIFFVVRYRQIQVYSETTDPFFLPFRRVSKSCGQIAGPQKLTVDQAGALLALDRTFSLEPSPASELGQCEHLQGVSCLQCSPQSQSLGNTAASSPSEWCQRKREEHRNGLRWFQPFLQGWGAVGRSHPGAFAHPVPPWLAPGLAVGGEKINHGPLSVSQITKPLTAGKPHILQSFPGTTFPSPVCTRDVSFWSFDLNHSSLCVISPNKKSCRRRLLH